ncbi:hypothetical protein [Burkholderia sp. SCN-KJ]|uniref:hypothetical protein n=1 Tax=Burkholderia sp. SCN-KJ TaxID=2969248 RepID=UPI00214F8B24|nr:hypothetical protein [Burkholderia sp. SCN-KJ]MCR4470406.1 hypothetical protein [Burkholderia sp. SCN-KJ]
MFAWYNVDSPATLASALSQVPPEYVNEGVATILSEGLSDKVRGLLVETEYVDKDFRSVFYNFYSKKGEEVKRNCVRLHLFREGTNFDVTSASLKVAPEENADEDALDDALSEYYLGFIVLRPTGKWNIGRSVIHPEALRNASGALIMSAHKVHILGHRLRALGFPWMMQHSDISVCAHVACWSIMRHYSERYQKYAELLLHDITKLAQPFDPGGLVPSEGLHVGHAERIFYAAGTFPVVVARPLEPDDQFAEADDKAFESQMLAYLESGFPLYAAMPDVTHAVAIVGVRWKEGTSDRVTRTSVEDAYRRVDALIASDDNHLPYVRVGLTDPIAPVDYSVKQVEAFIVPLPDKIFYPALGVYEMIEKAPRTLKLDFPPSSDRITRYYITTAAALHREFLLNSTSYDQRLVQAMTGVPMTQFVWVIEYATSEQWQRREVAVRVVIDATATEQDNEPLWLAFDQAKALIWREKGGPVQRMTTLALRPAKKPYYRIQSNLRSF